MIVTNVHVADAETAVTAKQIVVTLADGDSVPGRVLGVDRAQDLAVVKYPLARAPDGRTGDSDSLQVGDSVVAIGNALGIAGNPTVTSGIVSGLGRMVDVPYRDAGERDPDRRRDQPGQLRRPARRCQRPRDRRRPAIADPGSSTLGFAIAYSSAEPVVDALRLGRTPRIVFMGVKTETLTPSLVRQAHLLVQTGAYVADVTAGKARRGLVSAGAT